MLLLLLATLCALATSARAECEACVDGWCHSRKTLVEGFHITDQLAIDHTHNVLYLQHNSNQNIALYLDDMKIKLIQSLHTTGMTVDQNTHDLYVADHNSNIYKIKYGSDTPEVFSVSINDPDVDLLFHNRSGLFYTSRHNKKLSYINQNREYFYVTGTRNINITDFVRLYRSRTYYVADKKVFAVNTTSETNIRRKLVMDKNCILSIDKYSKVYLGDANERVIYKLNESDKPVEYAAYTTGSVDKFVFDRDNNIVFHDAADGSIATWKKRPTKCKIHAPHARFIDELDEEDTTTTTDYVYDP